MFNCHNTLNSGTYKLTHQVRQLAVTSLLKKWSRFESWPRSNAGVV